MMASLALKRVEPLIWSLPHRQSFFLNSPWPPFMMTPRAVASISGEMSVGTVAMAVQMTNEAQAVSLSAIAEKQKPPTGGIRGGAPKQRAGEGGWGQVEVALF